jgi:hypothetical protein
MDLAEIEKKLARIPTIQNGSQPAPTAAKKKREDAEIRACVMQAVAYVAGEPWSDHPECACPVITAFMIRWNDSIRDDAVRTRPLIPLLVGTRSTKEIEDRRRWMATNWTLRERFPVVLRKLGEPELAAKFEALPEIVSRETAGEARLLAQEVSTLFYRKRDEAWAKREALWVEFRKKYPAADAADAAYAAYAAYAASAASAPISKNDLAATREEFDALIVAAKKGGYSAALELARKTVGARVRETIETKWADAIVGSQASTVELVKRMCELRAAKKPRLSRHRDVVSNYTRGIADVLTCLERGDHVRKGPT